MELRQLRYFVAVVETGGFRKAAEACYVAQPSLSQQIKKLEEELGHQLFDRLRRKAVLTEAGHALLPRAREILATVEDVRIELGRERHAPQERRLVVGILPTIAPFLLPGTLKRFLGAYPQTHLVVHEALTQVLVNMLLQAQIDIALLSTPLKEHRITTRLIFTEDFLVALPREHPLAGRSALYTHEIEKTPFIALDQVHCLGEQVESFCYTNNLRLATVCQGSQISTVQTCIARGIGISILPRMAAVTDTGGDCVYLPIADERPQRQVVAASNPLRRGGDTADKFIACFREEYRTLCMTGGPGAGAPPRTAAAGLRDRRTR